MHKFGTAILVAAAIGSSPAWAINTHLGWDGTTSISAFGCPNTTNYGQVITVKGYRQHLKDFSFWIRGQAGDGQSMVVRAEVMPWNGTRPTGKPIYESPSRVIAYADSEFHRETFLANMPITPKAQYILFLTIDRDFDQCTNAYTTSWGSVDDGTYTGGTFVYLNSGGDASQWTTNDWTAYGIDLAFTASELGQN